MKKSFDYFKMFKEMSFSVCSSYAKMIKSEDFNSDLIRFSGLKWELLNTLLNEFVAPIERNDIYYLTQCLTDELNCISNINTFLPLVDINTFNFKESVTSVLNQQTSVFYSLKEVKNYNKIFKSISENKATLNGINTSINILCKNRCASKCFDLNEYIVFHNFSCLYKSIDRLYSEIQRIIINNN